MGTEYKREKRVKNRQIGEIREEVEAFMTEPEFEEMSRAFKHSLAQRLGLEQFKEGGLVLQAPTPVTLRGILEDAGVTDPDQLKHRLDDLYAYGNIYSYSFW